MVFVAAPALVVLSSLLPPPAAPSWCRRAPPGHLLPAPAIADAPRRQREEPRATSYIRLNLIRSPLSQRRLTQQRRTSHRREEEDDQNETENEARVRFSLPIVTISLIRIGD